MNALLSPAASPLKENIIFLTIGSFVSSLAVLAFDNRLYTTVNVAVLFTGMFLLFIIHAFAGSMKDFVTRFQVLLFYARILAVSFVVLCVLYLLFLPFRFDLLATLRFAVLITFIETSLAFLSRYKKQFVRSQEKEKIIGQTVQQQKQKELEVLKQQIDPHFIFNSFNTLAYLIEEDSGKAKEFSNRLAKVYRYLIFNSSKNLVSLDDELGFAKDYAYLQQIRHSNEVQISFTGFANTDRAFLVPVSIQLLLENAIKHNSFSEKAPLLVSVRYNQNFVLVENKLTTDRHKAPSSKIGLANLRDRCSLILGKEPVVEKTEDTFRVLLPVLHQ